MIDTLKHFIVNVLQELHFDPKMKAILTKKKEQQLLVVQSRAKGLALRWSLDQNIELSSEIEDYAKRVYVAYLKQYGYEVAPIALNQALTKKFIRNKKLRKHQEPISEPELL